MTRARLTTSQPLRGSFEWLTAHFGRYLTHFDTFAETVLPSPDALDERYGYQSFRTHWGWRQEVRADVSLSTRLMVAMHLAGAIVLAAPLEGKVRYVEIDLDAKTRATAATLRDRALLVSGLFSRHGLPTGVMWGSSGGFGGGLRYRISFDIAHEADSLRERTLELLVRAGVQEQPGLVEVYPHGGQVLRLPLGAGSTLCDEDGGFLRHAELPRKIIGGRHSPNGSIRRHVPEMVGAWKERVNERRTTVPVIFGPASVISIPATPAIRARACPTQYKRNKGGDASPSSTVESAWRAKMDDLYVNGAPSGGRFYAAGDVLFDLRINQGHMAAVALEKFGEWLRRPHRSKDLSGPRRERVIRQMERDGERFVAQLERRLEAGTLGTPRRTPAVGLHRYPLLSTSRERDTHGAGWRAALLASLGPPVSGLLADVATVRLRNALGILAALLARYREANPSATVVPIPVGVFKTIMGGGRGRWELEDGTKATPYRVLIEQAQLLGILGRIHADHSREKHTATIFRLP